MAASDPKALLVRTCFCGAEAPLFLSVERAFQSALDGSCRTPIAGLAEVESGKLTFHGEVLAPDGSEYVDTQFQIDLGADALADAARAGLEAGQRLRPQASKWLSL